MSDYTVSRFVFKYTLIVDTDGTTQDYYVTTHGFRTKPTDSPANYHIEERVDSAGSVKRSLFSGARAAGYSAPSYGVTTLVNTDGGLDDFVKYATGGYVTCYYGDDTMTFPEGYTVVYTTKVFSVVADFEKVHIRYQDRSSDLDKPVVTAMLAGTGELEGYSGISARKPLAFGLPGLMPLTLVDKTLQVYLVQANAVDYPFLAGSDPFAYVFEGGALVQRDNTGNYISSTDLFDVAQAPSPGKFRLWTGYTGTDQGEANSYTKGPIYLRMGTPPTGEIRFGHRGLLQDEEDVPPRFWKFSDLCRRAGMEDVYPDNMGLVNGALVNLDVGNRFVDDDRTYLAVMNDRAQADLGFFGFDRLGQFYCGHLQGPESGLDLVQYTFTYENSKDFVKEPIDGMESPVYQANVNAGKTRPMTPVTGASEEMTDLVSRDPWYTKFVGTSEEIRTAYPGAKVVTLEIDGNDFQSTSEQTSFLNRFFALYGKQRDFITLTCLDFSPATLSLALHDKVTLQVPRFDYAAGVDFRIVDIETNLDNKEIKFGLWGNDSPGLPWVLGGGGYPAGSGDPGGSNGGGGSTPPGGGGGSTNPNSPSYTQTLMSAFTQEMLCVDTPPGVVQEYTMADLAAITRVMAEGEPGYVGQVLLLHGDGNLTDSSVSGKVVTGVNGATTSTVQSKFGGSALFFDGSNDYFTVPDHEDFNFGSQAFSVDFWLYLAAAPNTDQPLVCQWVDPSNRSWYIGTGVTGGFSGVIKFLSSDDGVNTGVLTTSPDVVALNTWTHIAVWRIGSTIRFAFDGVIVHSASYSVAPSFNSTASVGIGALGNGASPAKSMYMDDLRICVNKIPYGTVDFTAPTAPHVE